LGLSIPLIASILPIDAALGKNLTESIDHRRSKTVAVKYHISRSDEEPVFWSLVLVGSLFFIFGLFIYYGFPLSLVSVDLGLLLSIFFSILIGMIFGLVLLSLNFTYLLEEAVCYLLFFWEKEALIALTLKNLIAHRTRNRQTTLMYSVSLAFVIFVTMCYFTQINTFKSSLERSIGADMKVSSNEQDSNRLKIGIQIQKSLVDLAQNFSCVEDFGWKSHSIDRVVPNYGREDITNIGHVASTSDIHLVAVSPNFLDVCTDGFLVIDSRLQPDYGLLDALYSVEGSASVMLPTILKQSQGLRIRSTDLLFHQEVNVGSGSPTRLVAEQIVRLKNFFQRLQPLGFLDKAPDLDFTKYPRDKVGNAVVSFPTFLRLSRGYFKSIDDIPLQEFLVRFKKEASAKEKSRFHESLRELADLQAGLSIDYFEEEVEGIEEANLTMSFFFNLITVIAMSICFFALISSTYTNIYEQTKEIGILLAIGLPAPFLKRLYVYEAFILVFSASLSGVMIGAAVSWTMTIQQILICYVQKSSTS